MKVIIKHFNVDMEIKNNGINFGVYSSDGRTYKGDFILTKTGVIWCKGKTTVPKGKNISWDKLVELLEKEA